MLPDHGIGSPEDWIRHARGDLKIACPDSLEGYILNQLCFHAQQSVEKSLKAVLIKHGIDFPKTHNIKLLIESLPGSIEKPSFFDELPYLTDFAVAARYPGIVDELTDDEYREIVDLAAKTLEWAKKCI